MADKLFFLLTMLPALPALGEPFAAEDTLAKIREEGGERLSLLADLIEVEAEIERCGMQVFVLGSRDFHPRLSERLPESFVETFMSFSSAREADWLTSVYAAWFDLLIEAGDQTGSGLLKMWAKWEYSLRTLLRLERLKIAGRPMPDDSVLPRFMKDSGELPDNGNLVEAYKTFNEPMRAEKFLDQARIDYLRKAAVQFSFTIDELVAYVLEMRIHNRYARLSPDKGRKILEEVTTL